MFSGENPQEKFEALVKTRNLVPGNFWNKVGAILCRMSNPRIGHPCFFFNE